MVTGILVDEARELLIDLAYNMSIILVAQDDTHTRRTQPRLKGVDGGVGRGLCLGLRSPYCRGLPCRPFHSVCSRV